MSKGEALNDNMEALLLSERQFRGFFETNIAGAAQIGSDLRYLRVNDKFCEITGYSRDELLEMTPMDLVHPEEREWDRQRLVRLFEDPQYEYDAEKRYVCNGGYVIWVRVRAAVKRGIDHAPLIASEMIEDITVRKQVERSLAAVRAESDQLKRLYEAVMSSTPDLVYVFDRDHRFIYANNALLAMWGRTAEEALGKSLHELGYEPWHAEMHEREIDQVVRTKQPVRGEVPFCHETLGHRIYDYILVPVLGENGDVEAVAGTTRDITERKQDEDRLRAVLDNLPVGVWFTDADGTIRYGNPAGEKIWQGARYVGPDQFHEYKAWWFDTGEPLAPDQWAVHRAITRGEASVNEKLRIQCFDGTQKIILNSAVPMRGPDGQTVGVVVLNENVTERTEAEQALKLELADNQRLQEISTRLIYQGDVDALFAELLQAAIDLTRADKGLLQGFDGASGELHLRAWQGFQQPFLDYFQRIKIGSPTSAGAALESGRRVIVPDVESCDFIAGTASDEVYRQAGVRAVQSTPLISRAGDILGMISTHWLEPHEPTGRQLRLLDILARQAADLIERHQTETALRELSRSLEQRVAERTRTVERKSQQLRKLMNELSDAERRERQQLAELLHDDLQQTLVGARMQMEMASERIRNEPVVFDQLAKAAGFLDEAIESARTLSHELSPPTLRLRGFIAGIRWLAEQMEAKHGLHIDIRTTGSDDCVPDPVKFMVYKAVREMLFNTVKHADVNEAKLAIHCANRMLEVRLDDEGRGFDSQEALNNDTSAGLGLLSIRERLTMLGGRLDIYSSPGAGSRFRLTVPLPEFDTRVKVTSSYQSPSDPNRDVSTPEPASEQASASSSRIIRILLIDDHEVIRQGLAMLLADEPDIEVVAEANNGREGVEAAERLQPDVVIMDMTMPEMSGDEATRLIKQQSSDIRVIALSMHEKRDAAERMLEAGADAYLTKAGPSRDLIAAIRRLGQRPS